MKDRRSFLLEDAPAVALASAIVWAEFGSRSQAGPPSSRSDSKPGKNKPVDAAPFARVVTSDPTRMDGARANRIEEYRAEDLFLETEVPPSPDGAYIVPVASDGMASIGLDWYERRPINALELQFADPSHVPGPEKARIQVWVGVPDWFNNSSGSLLVDTPWQGRWLTLAEPIEYRGDRWYLDVNLRSIPEARRAVRKIRWLFPPSLERLVIRRLSAFTDDIWGTTELRVECQQPISAKPALIEVYNGTALETESGSRVSWNMSSPLRLKLHYISEVAPPGSSRTVLWFTLPKKGEYAVAVEDVLKHEYVYVPEAGLLVARGSASASLSQHQITLTGKKTVLEQVGEMSDQSLTQAMQKVHHPIQDSGPMLLSLACDNQKFILEPDGTVLIEFRGAVSDGLVSKFKAGDLKFTTELWGGWLPVPVRTAREGGVIYRQTTFIAPYDTNGSALKLPWLNRRPLGVVQYTIENSSSMPADVSLLLSATTNWEYLCCATTERRSAWLRETRQRLSLKLTQHGAVVEKEGKVFVSIDTSEASELRTTLEDNVLRVEGALPAGAQAQCWAYLPRWEMRVEDCSQLRGGIDLLDEVQVYWHGILRSGTQIEVPDPTLMNIIRAAQVHGLISSRNELSGERIEQWGASVTYRGLNAMFYVIPALDKLGFHDFARRALDFYNVRFTPEGLLSDGYTLAGIGWQLELLWDHYQLTRDLDWLREVSPQIARACWWIVRQREKTKKLGPQSNKLPEYGLTPPGVTADWGAYNYYFSLAGYFFDGLQAGAKALAEIEYEDTDTLQVHVKDFHQEILRAYRWAQSRMPVNRLRNGTWVPPYPSQVPLPGTLGLFFPGEDHTRLALGCYDVELGAHNLVPLGVLDPNSQDVRWMLNHMEDFWFLSEGYRDFPASASEKDWFNLGGFSKVQPNLCRVPEIYATLDEIKPFIRMYFNFIASLINKQNLTFWEVFTPDSGSWGSTESSGYFLVLTRLMMLTERGDELWLAPLLTDQWFREGMEVVLTKAPTRFGLTSYRIKSYANKGYIEAEVESPTRMPPREIVIRLRHPEGKRIRTAKVGGVAYSNLDPSKDIIRLKPSTETIHVMAEY